MWPVEVVTVKVVAVPTTWLLVTMSPLPSKTIPEPRPSLVWICTTDGETRLKTPAKAFWRSLAAEVAEAGDVVAALLVAKPTPPATETETARMSRGSFSRVMQTFYPTKVEPILRNGQLSTNRSIG